MKPTTVALLLVAALAAVASVHAECPRVTTQENFNVEEFLRTRWYIQEQKAIKYLPEEWNYCTAASYQQKDKRNINVHNIANVGVVNGEQKTGNLCAVTTSDPTKLKVGPCWLPSIFYGPYWIVAAGPTPDNYEWALVSGGQPEEWTPTGCRNGSGTNNSGLWVFSRNQVASEEQIKAVKDIAVAKGFDITVLNRVAQEGCEYEEDPFAPKNIMQHALEEAYPALRGATL